MSEKLPIEILLDVMRLLGEESTLYLKSFTLLNRYWHSLAAPILLSTISVSSLGRLVDLCEHVTSSNNALRSIEAFTKTIVINGQTWENHARDSYIGLEDTSGWRAMNEADGGHAEPDVDLTRLTLQVCCT